MATLFELTSLQRDIEDSLYENGGEITPEIEEALALTQDSLPAKIDGYNALIRKMAFMEFNCKSEIERLTKLKKTAENGQKSLKRHIIDAMKNFGFKRLDGTTCKMTLSSTKGVSVDEDVLLADYRKKVEELNATLPDYLTVELKVSKSALRDAYKQSEVLPAGVEIVDKDTLTIR